MAGTKTKYEQIYDFIKSEIEAEKYQPGDLLPTDMELAAKFNTSRPTVAKAMNMLKSTGLVKRKPGYGTCIPRENDGGPLLTLGLLIPALGETEIFEPICGQIANLADEYNFNLLWGGGGTIDNHGLDNAIQLAEKYIAEKVDGVFFAPLELFPEANEQNVKIINMFKDAGIPVVLLDSDLAKPPLRSQHDLIGINNIEAGFIIASHLIGTGCKKIGFLTRPNIAGTVHFRLIGAREALLQADIPHENMQVFCPSGNIEDFAAAQDFSKLDALICYNDAVAAKLLVALDERGINIPEDLKICAFDDVKYASLIKIPLTTYRQPCREIGTAAVNVMITRIKNPECATKKVLLPGELVIRKSTKG